MFIPIIELGVVFLVALYFVPFMVAAAREHHRMGLVAIANALLGWTGVGWVALLVYAWRSPAEAPDKRRPRQLRVIGESSSAEARSS